jgi:hypothetical protein
MTENDCGSCDYQGRVEQKRAECRVDGKWHDRGYICEDFKEYVQGKNTEERISEAREIIRNREAREAERSRREFEEKKAQKDRNHAAELLRLRIDSDKKQWKASLWWQGLLVLIGAILGFIGGLVLQYLRK